MHDYEKFLHLGDGTKTLFEEMLHCIKNGKYGQDSERELMA